MIRSAFLTFAISATLAPTALAQTPFNVGNLVVCRIGDGLGTLGSTAAPLFLDEYTTGGALVQTIALPTTATLPQHAIVARGSATSEGRLNLSENGIYFLVAGYDAPVGTARAMYEGELAVNVNRVIARVDFAGNVDTSTALTDAYDGNGFRSVCSDNGLRFWLAGSSEGVRYVANFGDTTSTILNAGSPTNLRVANIYNGDVYSTTASTATATFGPVLLEGGLSGASGQNQVYLNGFPTTSGPSPYDIYFADPNTLYVADDSAINQGIQKWTQSGGTWTYQYTLTIGAQVARGLTGFTQNGVTTLWATSQVGFASGNGNDLITVTDTGPGSAVTVVTSSMPGMMFRGIRYFAQPSSLMRVDGIACSTTADIKATGTGQVGTDVITTVLTPSGFPFINFGTTQLNIPICTCTVLSDIGGLVAGPTATLSIPNNPGLIGIIVFMQGVDLFDPAAAGCPILPLATLTDGYFFSVQ